MGKYPESSNGITVYPSCTCTDRLNPAGEEVGFGLGQNFHAQAELETQRLDQPANVDPAAEYAVEWDELIAKKVVRGGRVAEDLEEVVNVPNTERL